MKHPPCKESPFTRIWDMTERLRALPNKGMENPEDDAAVRVWWVHAPWMAPMNAWHWHYVVLIHLRDLPGQSKPPIRRWPEATHELLSLAIDPEHPMDPQAEEIPPGRFLQPVSICQQFEARDDAEALELVERCLDMTLDGRVTLESDGQRAWEHLLLECEAIRGGRPHAC